MLSAVTPPALSPRSAATEPGASPATSCLHRHHHTCAAWNFSRAISRQHVGSPGLPAPPTGRRPGKAPTQTGVRAFPDPGHPLASR